MKEFLDIILAFITDHWLIISPVVVEILLRIIPTKNNVSIVDLLVKLVGLILPNNREPQLEDETPENNSKTNFVPVKRSKHIIKCLVFLCLFLPGMVHAQLNGTFRTIRYGNAVTGGFVGSDTATLNLDPTTYPIGTLIREINSDTLYYKFPDGFWHPISGGGGGAPSDPNTSIQWNDNGAFGGDASLLWNATTNVMTIGNTQLYVQGTNNAFWGQNAGTLTATGQDNVGIGRISLGHLTTGNGNTGVGEGTNEFNETGDFNTAMGAGALQNNETGAANTALGYRSQVSSFAGVGNTSVGYESASTVLGSVNTAVGYQALRALSNANSNTAIGYTSLTNEVAGTNNTAVGAESLRLQNGGGENAAFGFQSGATVSTGDNNTFVGAYSGGNVTSGSNNVMIGHTIFAQSATGNNQLSIQNAIFGVNNSSSSTTISSGNIGMYVTSPTARLHLPASNGTAGTAPLKLGSASTLLPTEEPQAVESTDTHVYWTDGAGARWQLDQQGGGASPGGANTNVQFNDAGAFGGVSTFTWTSATERLVVGTSVADGILIDGSDDGDGRKIQIGDVGSNVISAAKIEFSTGAVIEVDTDDLTLQTTNGTNGDIRIAPATGFIFLTGIPTTCTGAPTGALANISGTLTVCP